MFLEKNVSSMSYEHEQLRGISKNSQLSSYTSALTYFLPNTEVYPYGSVKTQEEIPARDNSRQKLSSSIVHSCFTTVPSGV